LSDCEELEKKSFIKVPVKAMPHATSIPKLIPVSVKKCPFKPTKIVSHTKTPLNYKKTESPAAECIQNILSPSLVTTVKPNLAHAGTPKRVMVGRDAAVMSRYSAACGFEESPHTRRPCLMPQPCP
jgi:hypothetical protein